MLAQRDELGVGTGGAYMDHNSYGYHKHPPVYSQEKLAPDHELDLPLLRFLLCGIALR